MVKQWSGYMDGYLKKNLDAIKEIIKKDWDMVFIVDGVEGAGKSVLAQQCAKYVDESFNIDRIAFTPEEFKDCINKAQKFEAIIYDEAYGGLSSRAAISEVNRSLVSMLAEIRQKNLYVFIVLPCFFELDKYASVWRSRGLLHVYTGENFERGKFTFYNYERKKSLYILGKKYYSYSKPAPNFRACFTAGYTVPDADYRAKKLAALGKTADKPMSLLAKGHIIQRNEGILIAKESGMDNKEIAKRFQMDVNSIGKILREKGFRQKSGAKVVTNLQLKAEKKSEEVV